MLYRKNKLVNNFVLNICKNNPGGGRLVPFLWKKHRYLDVFARNGYHLYSGD